MRGKKKLILCISGKWNKLNVNRRKLFLLEERGNRVGHDEKWTLLLVDRWASMLSHDHCVYGRERWYKEERIGGNSGCRRPSRVAKLWEGNNGIQNYVQRESDGWTAEVELTFKVGLQRPAKQVSWDKSKACSWLQWSITAIWERFFPTDSFQLQSISLWVDAGFDLPFLTRQFYWILAVSCSLNLLLIFVKIGGRIVMWPDQTVMYGEVLAHVLCFHMLLPANRWLLFGIALR